MKSAEVLMDQIAARHTKKLKYWYDLLREIMPDYFFKTFSAPQIEEILPLLFNIENQTGIQKISRADNVILIYLKSAQHNLLTTSKLMMEYDVRTAVIHESKQKIVINHVPQTLVIEYYAVAGEFASSVEPLFSERELAAAYRKIFKKSDLGIKEIYARINWDAVTDLTVEKLAERLHHVLAIQACDYPDIAIEKCPGGELRLTFARTNSQAKGVYYRVIDTLNFYGFNINRAYARQITRQDRVDAFDHMPVTITTFYLDGKGIDLNGKKVRDLFWQMRHITWCNMEDFFHRELVEHHGWTVADANFMRAAAAFIHSQLAFVDRNVYHHPDIWRYMALYEPVLREMLALFRNHLDPAHNGNAPRTATLITKISHAIHAVNTGMGAKDTQIKTVLDALLNFIICIRKTNFFVANKACLSFRLDPGFMAHYERLCSGYKAAFPTERPYGVFFFFRENCISFQIRFADIARGGWRTVAPKAAENLLERNDNFEFAQDELFRETFVLAHTQHMKNKDIYEGGAKMVSLLHLDHHEFKPLLYLAQRATATAFLQLINYDAKGMLRESAIIDHLGTKEIIEIGPDENMHDVMIEWLGNYAERAGYTLGAGIISGKPDRGINHKEFGVTSFGLHQYLLKTLNELGIDPGNDPFSVKISGGPTGDVAGNELKLLLAKKADGTPHYPRLKIVAITDGPAAVYDPDGLDRAELTRLIHCHDLAAFNPEKLTGENAAIVYADANGEIEKHRLVIRGKNGLVEKLVDRDEFMRLFQDNLTRYADIFIPCGGRPSTIDTNNWQKYVPDGKSSMRAIVEGANSFLTPAARDRLQEAGIMVIKDASANKCGVITSSYEIISGLMLSEEEFKAVKHELVTEIMNKLKHHAEREAEWLFTQFKLSGHRLTDLTEQLSAQINAKNDAITAFLDKHPKLVKDDIILSHLPKILATRYADRLDRIPPEYRKAIAAVELATQIVYGQPDSLEQEINIAIRNLKI